MMRLLGLVDRKVAVARAAVMPNVVPLSCPNLGAGAASGGIIKHPQNFPLAVRSIWPWHRLRRLLHDETPAAAGLQFFSGGFYAPRTTVEISISLRHHVHRFRAVVVAVRNVAAGYEISAWLTAPADSERLRLVEQICALECRIRPKANPEAVKAARESHQRAARPRTHALRLA